LRKYIHIPVMFLFLAAFLLGRCAVSEYDSYSASAVKKIPAAASSLPTSTPTFNPVEKDVAAQPKATETRKPSQPAAKAKTITPAANEENPAALASETPLVEEETTHTPQVLAQRLPAERWKEWPVIPEVSEELRAVYQRGLAQGNNPNAFSVLGDCQSQPEVFMGLFDNDPDVVHALPVNLQETVAQFSGSFDRYSPTVKDGTTEGALLWVQWNDNKEKKCENNETPLDCELRVQQPSIIFIHIGTHYEARNRRYLSIIIEKVLEAGAVPVLVTKADNRELDERVNQNLASLAEEYNLPLWNFWASVQHLPDHGMEKDSDMYLSESGMEIHRMDALQALDQVWRSVR
jgi:hypothetical protein